MKLFMDKIITLALTFMLVACAEVSTQSSMDQIAENYVKLVLAYGEHEEGYVDAYYGPEEWAIDAKATTTTLDELKSRSQDLIVALEHIDVTGKEKIEQRRHRRMLKQLISVEARIRMTEGEKFTFDEETRLLYDAVSPAVSEAELEAILAELDAMLPGEGDIQQRAQAFREEFVIPDDKLDAVMRAAIKECRSRTLNHIPLPEGENFALEFVKDQSWGAYNWYQGSMQSLIQINTDDPIPIDMAIYYGCHEGYPGHHVSNMLMEEILVNEREWVEFSVQALYSPQGFLMEGPANYGIVMAFPEKEKLKFESEVLYLLAGIDPASSLKYEQFNKLEDKMKYARPEGARRYLDGKISREELVKWYERYRLASTERAERGVRFTEQFRGYEISYTLGMDLVGAYIDRVGGDDIEKRWKAYEALSREPFTPTMLSE